jgi:GTP-binding protein Era
MTERDDNLSESIEDVDLGEWEETPEQVMAQNERLLAEFLAKGDAEAPLVREEVPPDHRSGFVAVVGKPNVGKSTLMNAYLGEKLAIVSPKPQTTRARQLGILTRPDVQIVFVDTPGIHKARNKLGEFMVDVAKESIPDADVILFLVDVSELPTKADEIISRLVNDHEDVTAFLVLNKSDLVDEDQLAEHRAAYEALIPAATPVVISATRGDNCDELLDQVVRSLPLGPRYYPEDQLTETHVRDNVTEIIREHVLHQYEHEVPHSVAVQVEQFKEREDIIYISATIYVERDSQKGIIIGKQGSALKQLGQEARHEIEDLLSSKVYLELWVKVLKNWRKNEAALRRLGYKDRRR